MPAPEKKDDHERKLKEMQKKEFEKRQARERDLERQRRTEKELNITPGEGGE